ncbi:MAG: SUMF1/EgtB/PvdO family nonheme iron enzyme [Rhodocyclaceae bacterium]|nr:SUMF1/EgtB/PvdO family nonheme iron enzyme [Rhodocyclaceae bacterium]
MSDGLNKVEPRLGFLLLRDSHAVPLRGISPDEIKAGAKARVPHPDAEPIRHRQTLDAIVHCLGFNGDFGSFTNEGWPQFNQFLRKFGCTRRVGVFPADHGGCIDLNFVRAPGPRQLADRVFEARPPVPVRVFLGYGVNWQAWDGGTGRNVSAAAIATLTGDPASASERARNLYGRRFDLIGQFGFLDDKLVEGPLGRVIDKTYWPPGSSAEERKAHHAQCVAAVRAFRAVFDTQREGWVDILPYNERLVVLRTHDGGWDVIWRGYREKAPPESTQIGSSNHLAVCDLPSLLMTESDLKRVLYFRQSNWDELEAHEAEQAFYDRGGSMLSRQLTSEVDVRVAYLREQGKLPAPTRKRWPGEHPVGFRKVKACGRTVAVSGLIEVGSFRRMLAETSYAERRADHREPWERANEGGAPEAPVGASWADAQAYCAWMEQQLEVALRLPTREELRALRPFFSPHYEAIGMYDFPWEHFPPRPLIELDGRTDGREVPSAVAWSEPRFLAPSADLPEYPPPSGIGGASRKAPIKDFPPRAAWKAKLPWADHAGLRFIDAWDAYEWCQELGWISGRFWEGQIGPTSWGAYKNVKVGFRIVLDIEE